MAKQRNEPPTGLKNRELMDALHDKYRGGGRKETFRFYFKKFSWIIVTESAYFLKRAMDMVVSGVLLICLAPVFLLIAVLIKLEDPGPVFFSQIRVGKWGKTFRMHKFRSMVVNAEALLEKLKDRNESSAGVIFKMKDDPRITKVGKFIRKTSLDELPQFWNVFKGDMSLVGPRPPIPKEVAEYEYTDRRRLDAIPGITCIWQVSGRSNIDFKGQVRLDVQYIENQSFWGDIKLLLMTVPAVLFSKGAY
jgi:exopolysaccharide biosynthesis polyprenyl glycosylphosphotransferase